MSLATGRDIALMYFILIAFVAGTVPLAALFLAVTGLRLLRRRMMPYIHLTQFYFSRIERIVGRMSKRVAEPFIVSAGFIEQVRSITARFAAIFKNGGM